MSALGQVRHRFLSAPANVRLGSKADIGVRPRNVCFTPRKRTFCAAAKMALFDHLIGDGEHACGNGETERFGGRAVDDELEFGCLQHRQVSRLSRSEELIKRVIAGQRDRAFVVSKVEASDVTRGAMARCL